MKAEVMGPLSAQTEVQAKQMSDGRIKVEFLHAPYNGSSIVVEGPPAPSSVSNPVALNDFFKWWVENDYTWNGKEFQENTGHDDFETYTPADLYALFTSQHGEQETQNKWMEAGLRLVAELYKKHRFILKNLDVANEDKNIFLYRLGISTEHMDNH